MKTVVLDPETWMRGGGEGSGYLLYGEQKCCMGFAALDFGASRDEIDGMGVWADCPNTGLAKRDLATVGHRFHRLYEINDEREYEDAERVRLLNAELERLDEDFRFVLKGQE